MGRGEGPEPEISCTHALGTWSATGRALVVKKPTDILNTSDVQNLPLPPPPRPALVVARPARPDGRSNEPRPGVRELTGVLPNGVFGGRVETSKAP